MKELALLMCALYGASLAARQCCDNGELMRKGGFCGDGNTRININCTVGHIVLRDTILKGDELSTQDSPDFIFAHDPNDYCVGEMYRNASSDPLSGTIPSAIVCFQPPTFDEFEITGTLTLVSVVFLLLTFSVYMFLPELRDLQGLCYMCLCISMALGFLSLGLLQLNRNFHAEICTMSGFMVYFWLMATFFWMNVISINTYRNVTEASYLKRTERKQFLFYSCYAWGCTITFLVAALATNFVEGDHLKPGIGVGSCWFDSRIATWAFFYGPIAVLLFANVLLFILSSYRLWRDTRKYEVSRLNTLKFKFLVSLKLFLVMGISWIFEVAGFAHGESHIIWKIADTFNCLQGVVIFLILVVLRQKAIRGLVKASCCLPVTGRLADRLSPHDDSCDQNILDDEHTEVRLN